MKMRRVFVFGLLWLLGGQAHVFGAAPLDATAYHRRLVQTEAALRRLETSPNRPSATIQRLLPPETTIRRADGATQNVSNVEFRRLLRGTSSTPTVPGAGGTPKAIPARKTARQVRQIIQAVRQRRTVLEEWMRPGPDGYYQEANAGRIVKQLVSSGQIRVGPTALQQWWHDVKAWFGDLLEKITRAIFGNNITTPNLNAPKIDENWLKFFFYSAVLSLLGVLGYLLWKALGGRWSRQGARREVRYLEGEDAELLKLPSDELADRAARFAANRDFREALRHRYIALLVEFDERGIWRYDTRRTNWEHVRALRSDATRAPLMSPLGDLTLRFDRVRYGDASVSHTDWEHFAHDAKALETRAQGVMPNVGVTGKEATKTAVSSGPAQTGGGL
jgi:hypothetical protein